MIRLLRAAADAAWKGQRFLRRLVPDFRRTALVLALLPATGFAMGHALDESGDSAPRGVQEVESPFAEANRLLGQGQFAEAAIRYREVTKNNPQNGLAWYRFGLALHLAGDFKGALPAHKRAAAFERYRTPALYNVACAYSRLQETEEAIAWLSRARRAMVDDTDLIEQMQTDVDLEWVRADPRFKGIVAGTYTGDQSKLDVRSCELPEGSDFDFRIGEWDVTWSGGKARSVVERVLDDCILREHFAPKSKAHSHLEGLMLASFVPATGKWRQAWADGSGRLIQFEGGLREGRMVLEGFEPGAPRAEAARLRVRWFNIRPHSYDWEYERSKDGGETWHVLWRARYTRR